MSFSTILFTEKGRALQSKVLAGTVLTFTRIGMGSGSLGGQSQIALNNLIDQKVSLNVTQVIKSGNYAVVEGNFRNADVSTGFYWKELGIFAQDPDIGEILYCYGNAGSLAEYIPPQSSEIVEKVVGLSVIVGDTANVTLLTDSTAFATKGEVTVIKMIAEQALEEAGNPPMVNGHTVESDVPANAKFTDTVYTHPATHPASMITGLPAIPTSLPANGGNADSIGGHPPCHFTRSGLYESINYTSTTYPSPYMASVYNVSGFPSLDWYHVVYIPHTDSSGGYAAQIAVSFHGVGDIYVRSAAGTNWGAWRKVTADYGTADLTAGVSALSNGSLYFVYE